MTNNSDTKQNSFNLWPRGGQAKTSEVNATMADFLKSQSLTFDTSKMQVDVGSNTADAVRQPDGSWEVKGKGSTDLISSLAVSAEYKARKVAFLPRQVERKVARSAQLALLITNQITLSDGTVIRRANSQG
jgi:hypothetical protein